MLTLTRGMSNRHHRVSRKGGWLDNMAMNASQRAERPGTQPESLRDQVYKILRAGLRTGAIRPNQHLREQSLSEQLGVSRTPIREALALLQRDGLLVQTSKGLMLPTLTLQDIREIYEIRKLLEPAGMKVAAEHATRSDVVALRSAVAAQVAAQEAGNVAQFLVANAQFRDVALNVIPSSRLRRAIEIFEDHVEYMRSATMVDASVRDVVLAGLNKVVDAIAAHDGDAASAAMLEHLANGERVLGEMYPQIESNLQLGSVRLESSAGFSRS